MGYWEKWIEENCYLLWISDVNLERGTKEMDDNALVNDLLNHWLRIYLHVNENVVKTL